MITENRVKLKFLKDYIIEFQTDLEIKTTKNALQT